MKPAKILLWGLLLSVAGAFASPQSSKQGTVPALQQLKSQYPNLGSKIDQAVDKINDSLFDDTHRCDCDPDDGDDPEDGRPLFIAPDVLDPERGERTFDKEEGAVDILTDLISRNTTPAAAKPAIQNVANTLAGVDRDVSRKAIDDARAFLGSHANSNQDIQQAEARYAQGLVFIQQVKPRQAIEKFEDSWKEAMEVSAPHFAFRHAKALCTLLRNTNRRLDRIQGQSNQDAKYRALGNLVVARVSQLQSRLSAQVQHFSQKTGIPQAQVLQQINLIIQQTAGTELESALNATISRLEALAAGNFSAATKAALQAAADALRGIGAIADRTPPQIASLVPAEDALTISLRPVMSASFSDALSGVLLSSIHITLDGGDITAQAHATISGFSFTPASDLSQGTHILLVSLADKAGNVATATRHFTTDNQPPQITAFVPADGSFTAQRRPAISVAYNDAASGVNTASVHLFLDGADVTAQASVTATGASLTPTADLSEAQHTMAISLSDRAGNPVSAQAHWTVDITNPVIAIAEPADGSLITTATPLMRISYSDALSGLDLSTLVILLDAHDVTASFSRGAAEATFIPDNMSALADGPHTLTARIRDLAGNEQATQSAFTVQTAQPDTTPPTAAIVFPRVSSFGNPQAFAGTTWRVVADSVDPGPSASGVQKVEFFIDGVKFAEDTTAPYEATIAFPANSAGQNKVLTVVATDNASHQTTSAGVTVVMVALPASGAISFRVSGAPTTIQAGTLFPNPITIEAIDAQGVVDPAYIGTIRFFTSDSRSSIAGRTVTFAAADHGVKQVNLTQLIFNSPPLLTAGQQIIAVADISNPARDQGVMSLTVTPAPVSLLTFGTLPTPHGGQTLAVQVNATDAFSNSVPGVQVQLEVFENTLLTQTLLVTTASPASFSVPLGASTDRVRLRASSPSHPALTPKEISRLVDVTASITGLPELLSAGEQFTVTFSVLKRDGTPLENVGVTVSAPQEPALNQGVSTPFGTPDTRSISASFQRTGYFTKANTVESGLQFFQSLVLNVPEGPLTVSKPVYVQPGAPVFQGGANLDYFLLHLGGQSTFSDGVHGVVIARDQFGNPVGYEPVLIELTINGQTYTQMGYLGADGTLVPTIPGIPANADWGGDTSVRVTLLRTGVVLTASRSTPPFIQVVGPIPISVAGGNVTLPDIHVQHVEGITRIGVVVRQTSQSDPPIVGTPTATGGVWGTTVFANGVTFNFDNPQIPGVQSTPESTVSGITVHTAALDANGEASHLSVFVTVGLVNHSQDIGSSVATPVVSLVSGPGLKLSQFTSSSFTTTSAGSGFADFLGGLPATKVVVMGFNGAPLPGGTFGTEASIAAVGVVSSPNQPMTLPGTLRSFTQGGDPVSGGGLPSETPVALLKISDTVYMSRPIRLVDPGDGVPLAGIPGEDPTFQTIATEPLGHLTMDTPGLGTAAVDVFGIDPTVEVTLEAGEDPVPGESGPRPLAFSIFRDTTPSLRFKPVVPGYVVTLNPPNSSSAFHMTAVGTGQNAGDISMSITEVNSGRNLLMEQDPVLPGTMRVRFGTGSLNPVSLAVGAIKLRMSGAFLSIARPFLPLVVWEQKVGSICYADQHDIVSPSVPERAVVNGNLENFPKRQIILRITDETYDSVASAFFGEQRATPIGIIRNANIFVLEDRMVDPDALIFRAHTLSLLPLVQASLPNFYMAPEAAGEEKTPTPFAAPSQDPAKQGGFLSEPFALALQHFPLRTYAMHGLVRKVLAGSPAPRSTIFFGDTGFGVGATAGLVDVPVERIVGVDDQLLVAGAPHPTDLRGIPDKDGPLGHGSCALPLAVGSGTAFEFGLPLGMLGTGSHCLTHVVRVSTNSSAVGTAAGMLAFYELGVSRNENVDPNDDIDVIYCNFGSLHLHPDPQILNDWITQENKAAKPLIERASNNGQVFVFEDDNHHDGPNSYAYPIHLAPQNLVPRQVSDKSTAMGIGAVHLSPDGDVVIEDPSQIPGQSYPAQGPHIHIAFPYNPIAVRNKAGQFHGDSVGGMSWAGPMAAGSVAELILLDRANSGKMLTSAEQTDPQHAHQLFAIKVLEAMEATGEHPDENVGDPFPNNVIGFGRANLWKAALVVINDGLPTANPAFPHLVRRTASDIDYYGFEVSTLMKDATLWIKTPGVAAPEQILDGQEMIKADQGVRTQSMIPVGVTLNANNEATNGKFIARFSIKRAELLPVLIGGQTQNRVLELRRPGEGGNASPFMSTELDLARMEEGIGTPGIQVKYSNFLFSVIQANN